MKTIEIYTDGGCVPNPGRGACAFVAVEGGKHLLHENATVHESTTNNIMELSAVINALAWAVENHKSARIYVNTDSQYVQLGLTRWIKTWKTNGWKNSQRKPVANKELWVRLDSLTNQAEIHFQWVKGHSNNHWNNHADKLCTQAIEAA